MKLAYIILKNLDDDIVVDKEIPELDQCSECNNEILTRPPKVITILSCGHTFHRICIEKKLLLTMPNTCPFPDCGKNVDIIEEVPTTDQESPISALSNRMNETFILSSPILRMEGIENTGFQQARSYLKCAKCSEDLSSWLPPISSIRFPLQPQGPPKHLVYLTCKHIVHYACIDNPRKLCPVCPSTDMESEEEEMDVDGEEQPDTSSKKRSNEGTDANSSTPKKKAKKPVSREDSPILKKLIKELSAPIPQQRSSGGIISLQTFPEMTDIKSVNFRELNDRIVEAEGDNQKAILVVIRSYYFFGKGYMLWFNHYKKTYSEDTSNSLVNDKIRECFLDQDKTSEANLRKRKERAIKIFKLFDGVGGEEKIYCIKSFSASTISRLGVDDIDYVIAKVLKASQ
ncbi:uncharacterized protein OCT59_022625 [Rhizophagus irregularis]|uniref:RING-type domain-containing protein n=1 Tax=Rhizophagus irregularis (strain DAOM 181602 / DAOM 197198 / MUCL 43194) TaxID=747089 RepID=U9STL3_RHIID|nr:hypothetical protein GLOIN_2v1769762 [Rhizophagus irregularis DAOM 181602=DAOM 197198]POG75738.1 hypothetical protein GLOIN_2v1769762 [Rhizophagus irregularis DAOM 181602=DAOM 197198]UZO29136.1 hypothetical protein OCT59_022625 [Rhizophagus irregularis]GBC50845.1 hypothetical protein GLOIN_2v1769762 [Rhizophagus irregularis DAOM 181602=DAOM 197198]|eukprot:XP_025182604.1 hypothetical protein GLOIN_2v1769762 [Rhizophagus irregularis DAOM 181602=DAOM 197198]